MIQVERKLITGTPQQLDRMLMDSEDSSTLNTSFIERHNLTIRQGSSYLHRRSPCHSREIEYLRGHLALLQCYYNFIRPHRALKFGPEVRTPAMQAGLVAKRLTFRDVFTKRSIFFLCVILAVLMKRGNTKSWWFTFSPNKRYIFKIWVSN